MKFVAQWHHLDVGTCDDGCIGYSAAWPIVGLQSQTIASTVRAAYFAYQARAEAALASFGLCQCHGGLSTGPKTPEGRAKIAQAQRARHAKARLRAQTLSYLAVGPIQKIE